MEFTLIDIVSWADSYQIFFSKVIISNIYHFYTLIYYYPYLAIERRDKMHEWVCMDLWFIKASWSRDRTGFNFWQSVPDRTCRLPAPAPSVSWSTLKSWNYRGRFFSSLYGIIHHYCVSYFIIWIIDTSIVSKTMTFAYQTTD